MLMWERLTSTVPVDENSSGRSLRVATVTQRLPYDLRCCAITKAGKRCRGRIRKDTDFCPFHDPTVSAEQRQRDAAKGGRCHHKLSRLPDGYLRKLDSRRAVGQAMDRLYRELRLGIVTPAMANVLFNILTRLLDSGLCDAGESSNTNLRAHKADRLRPKLRDLLTRAERQAWRQAIANAPTDFLRNEAHRRDAATRGRQQEIDKPAGVALPAAS